MTLNDKINEVAERVANSPITIRDPHGIKAIADKIRPLVREVVSRCRKAALSDLGTSYRINRSFDTLLEEIGESDD